MDLKDYQSGIGEDFFWFLGKKVLVKSLLHRSKITGGSRILDIGVGTGGYLDIVGRFGDVHLVDINPDVLALVPDGTYDDKTCADVCNLPFSNGSFDVIMAYDILEHVDDDHKALSEIWRCMKAGGIFIFTVPAYPSLFSYHDRALGHFRRYNLVDLQSKLRDFKEIETGYWVALLSPAIYLMRVLQKGKKEGNYVSRLPSSINWLLYQELNIESNLIRAGVKFPRGLTLFGIFKKSER